MKKIIISCIILIILFTSIILITNKLDNNQEKSNLTKVTVAEPTLT